MSGLVARTNLQCEFHPINYDCHTALTCLVEAREAKTGGLELDTRRHYKETSQSSSV